MKPKHTSWLRKVKKTLLKGFLFCIGLWFLSVLLWTVLPVPFSAVMAERQISAWSSGNFAYRAHSDWVSMDEISPWMPLAVIASEDQRFPEHWGIDFSAVNSALTQRGEDHLRGASTLSQQTAKNMFLWDGRSWVRKAIEAGMTLGIEAIWRKKRILTVYLNVAEFGPGIFGVEAASQAYFHKPAKQLTESQAALLAAVLPSPLRYKAQAPSRYIQMRQQWIMRQMRQLGGQPFLIQHHLY
ncbi:monofunctional biosynthetic peptidoglycan transglycosylase [Tatumella ptyseos]|uniref:monofunctional biosynthetic peptidoglycan transglycosylase n=1 Tax=Tatumella ptyseos TaxID=82987 RepID=UPI0026EE0AD7|nr:monofunctional biosynthetic peptidoglycan transglycosylase [Tatumella ptyseos]WKX26260.1 monofunctional biosynthetic peptidoglycan transglycosylase [Tatumella ptyseos]